MYTLKIGANLRMVLGKDRLWEFSLYVRPFKLDPLVLAIGKGYKFPAFQSEENICANLAYILFPFGNPCIEIPIAALTDTSGGLFDDFKKAFIVFCRVGVVGLPEELVGEIAQYGFTGLVPVHKIVLNLILEYVNRCNIIAP